MQIKNIKQREFWQARNDPASIKGMSWDIIMPKITKEEHRKRIQRSLDRDPRFKLEEI